MNSTPVSRRICACGRYFYIQKKKAEELFIKKQIHIRLCKRYHWLPIQPLSLFAPEGRKNPAPLCKGSRELLASFCFKSSHKKQRRALSAAIAYRKTKLFGRLTTCTLIECRGQLYFAFRAGYALPPLAVKFRCARRTVHFAQIHRFVFVYFAEKAGDLQQKRPQITLKLQKM